MLLEEFFALKLRTSTPSRPTPIELAYRLGTEFDKPTIGYYWGRTKTSNGDIIRLTTNRVYNPSEEHRIPIRRIRKIKRLNRYQLQ